MQPTLTDLEALARQAGAILRAGYESGFRVDKKGVIDLVTEIDHRSEAFLLQSIRERFPGGSILTEESGEHAGEGGRWYIDPLDGTVNYAHGIPFFTVSIAYARDGQVRLGVVYDPMRDELFSAEWGKGATVNGRALRASPVSELADALLVTGFPYSAWVSPVDNIEFFGRFTKLTRGVRRLGSAALDLCYVAAGRFDGYWELTLSPWDVAAGGLIAAEAGALVTTLDGGPGYIQPPCSILAAAPGLHAAMRAILAG